MVSAKDEYKGRDLIFDKQPRLYENDNENLYNNSCQHPLAGFAFASKNMPKGVGRFPFCAAATLS